MEGICGFFKAQPRGLDGLGRRILAVHLLLALPWYSGEAFASLHRVGDRRRPYAIWGVLALIVADRRRRRPRARAFSPADADPDHAARSRDDAGRGCGAVVILLLHQVHRARRQLRLGLLRRRHPRDVVTVGAWFIAQGSVNAGQRPQPDGRSCHRRRARGARGAGGCDAARRGRELQARLPDPRRRPRPHHRAPGAAARAGRASRRRRPLEVARGDARASRSLLRR